MVPSQNVRYHGENKVRDVRHKTHQVFDNLWQSKAVSRNTAYAWLACQLRIKRRHCHIKFFTMHTCYQVIDLVKRVNPDVVAKWDKERKTKGNKK